MKNVIIPMDFTDVSNNALKYAFESNRDAIFHIVHVTYGVNPNEITYLKEGTTGDSVLGDALRSISRSLNKTSIPEDNIKVTILRGEVIPCLRKYISDHSIDAIVMGTRDKYNLLDKWFGTVSLALVKTLDIPVLLVPPHSKFGGFKKVLVASDAHLENRESLDEILSWNRQHNAFIKFLHVKRSFSEDYQEKSDQLVESIFEKDKPEFGFEIVSVSNKDITQTLLASAYNLGADLIISISDDQSFINSLLFKSVSKELILKSRIPLLILNSKN